MILKEKERSVIEDLQTQEKSCVEKYGKYAEQARDPELKNLFRNIQQEEQKHYDTPRQPPHPTLHYPPATEHFAFLPFLTLFPG